MYTPKTDRRRGEIWGHIRQVIRRRKLFTAPDIVGGPVKNQLQASHNLSAMRQFGELKLVSRGRGGPKPILNVYRKAK